MRHYEAAEIVELGTATELVLGGWSDPPDNMNGDTFALLVFGDDVE